MKVIQVEVLKGALKDRGAVTGRMIWCSVRTENLNSSLICSEKEGEPENESKESENKELLNNP